MGYRKQIVKVEGRAYSIYGSSMGGSLDVYAVGYNIYHRSWNRDLSYEKNWDRTFFSASQWFTVGPVPVNLKESVSGSLGFKLSGGPTTTGVGANFEPKARAYGSASVSINIIVAALGVTGNVTLLAVGLPISIQAWYAGNCVNWSLNVKAWLNALSGNLKIWVRILIPKFTKTIANWAGYYRTWTLINKHGGISLK